MVQNIKDIRAEPNQLTFADCNRLAQVCVEPEHSLLAEGVTTQISTSSGLRILQDDDVAARGDLRQRLKRTTRNRAAVQILRCCYRGALRIRNFHPLGRIE